MQVVTAAGAEPSALTSALDSFLGRQPRVSGGRQVSDLTLLGYSN